MVERVLGMYFSFGVAGEGDIQKPALKKEKFKKRTRSRVRTFLSVSQAKATSKNLR